MTATTTTSSKTCFIAAPAGANLAVLRATLKERGLRVLVPSDLEVGVDWASEIKKQLARTDLVIGVISADQNSSWVLFELGQASALGCRIILIASPKADPIPFALHQFLVLRTEIDNADAIGFALDQVLSAPASTIRERPSSSKALAGLGYKADEFIERLGRDLAAKRWRSIEDLVADALRASGTDLVVTSPSGDLGADIAVWSDVLEPFVGNPLLIEVKGAIKGEADLTRATRQLAKYVGASGSRWGILLYGSGPEFEGDVFADSSPNVLALSIQSLFELLRLQAFPEVVRDMRNRRVHGVR
ncbi:TIR domain-containing protein [Pectobacterium polonicum]|uniref:TIR domain-containing protein n=1 Tax=Pectobacterium polonicum TaxID=2485124 RepID=UPI0037547E19